MKVTMTHATSDASHDQKIDIPTRDMLTEIDLSPDFMGPGDYTVKWRALGKDGHVLTGSFGFQIVDE